MKKGLLSQGIDAGSDKTLRMHKNSHWSEHTDLITMVLGVSVSRVQFDKSRLFMCIS